MSAAKLNKDGFVDIMPSPVKHAERCELPTPSGSTYYPRRTMFGIFNKLALSVKRRFQ